MALDERQFGAAHSTVAGWFDREDPTVPEVAQCVDLAKKENLSLDWLLLGEGERLLQVRPASDKLPDQLRAAVLTELMSERVPRKRLEAIVPSGEELLGELTAPYRHMAQWSKGTAVGWA